ncbi:MAG TPA: FHA domain-containing protein [Myxococcales bacterium]|nr:FHA domain-containing protein [Myxococcales bacterium]
MARVVVHNEGGSNRAFELSGTTTIGRHPSQNIQLLDRLVSKEHATIVTSGSQHTFVDLGSRNGSYLNNDRIVGSAELTEGDVIQLGSTQLTFRDTVEHVSTGGMAKVTIATDVIQSAIAARIRHRDDFVPASSIRDEEELRRNYDQLRMAYQLQRDIAGEVDLNRLLNKILDTLFASLSCDRCVILLEDEFSGKLVPKCVRVKSKDGTAAEDQEIQISQTVLSAVRQEKAAILSNDVAVDSRFSGSQSIIFQGIQSTMCVPLLIRDELLGVIHVDSKVAKGAFTKQDLHIVQGLAQQAAFAIDNSRLVQQRESDAVIREGFSRLVSPNLVEQLVSGELAIERGGEKVNATVLFTDLRGFTAMSQRKAPDEIVHMLNEYFEIMVDIVFDCDGTMDKFMGDGLMAVWGCPVEIENAAAKAVETAINMQIALAEFNETRRSEGLEEMHMGAGVNTGELVAGYMGSTKTLSYTVVGPPVNLAARLCSIAKPGQVLVSGTTLALLGDGVKYETLSPVQLKGIDQPVVPYNIQALKKG